MKIIHYHTGSVDDHKKVGDYLKSLWEDKPGEYRIEIKKNIAIRSLSHNAYYWVILTLISSQTGEYDRDRLHEVCKLKFNCETINLPKGGIQLIGKSTSDLDTAEFAAYVERVKRFAHDEWGILIPERERIDRSLMTDIENSYEDNFR